MHSRTRKSAEMPSRAAANRFDRPSAAVLSPAQRKFDTAQREPMPEEEELLQGKFKTAQLMGGPEEEELL